MRAQGALRSPKRRFLARADADFGRKQLDAIGWHINDVDNGMSAAAWPMTVVTPLALPGGDGSQLWLA
jgi:hypothetical protein